MIYHVDWFKSLNLGFNILFIKFIKQLSNRIKKKFRQSSLITINIWYSLTLNLENIMRCLY